MQGDAEERSVLVLLDLIVAFDIADHSIVTDRVRQHSPNCSGSFFCLP